MKTRFLRILGVALTLATIASLFVFATPVSAAKTVNVEFWARRLLDQEFDPHTTIPWTGVIGQGHMQFYKAGYAPYYPRPTGFGRPAILCGLLHYPRGLEAFLGRSLYA